MGNRRARLRCQLLLEQRYCCKQTRSIPVPTVRPGPLKPGRPRNREEAGMHHPEFVTCISRAPVGLPGPTNADPSPARHVRAATLHRRTSGRRPGDPLPSRADARARLSPHWPRRPRRARGRGRDRARARAEREAAAAPSGRARRGREPPRTRRGHARARPWHSGLRRLRSRPGGKGGGRGLRMPSPCSGPRAW